MSCACLIRVTLFFSSSKVSINADVADKCCLLVPRLNLTRKSLDIFFRKRKDLCYLLERSKFHALKDKFMPGVANDCAYKFAYMEGGFLRHPLHSALHLFTTFVQLWWLTMTRNFVWEGGSLTLILWNEFKDACWMTGNQSLLLKTLCDVKSKL